MKNFNPPTGESPLDPDVEEVRAQLRGMRGALAALRDRVEREDGSLDAQLGKVLTELRQLIRTTMDTEKRFEEREKEKHGVVHSYRLDLDEARSKIGSRLASLRRANDAGGVSGGA